MPAPPTEPPPAYRFTADPITLTTAALALAAETVVRLVLALPARLAAAGRLAAVLDADPDWLEFVLGAPDGLDGCVSRPDLVHAGGRFWCVDVNAAHAGGWTAVTLWQPARTCGAPFRDPVAAVFDLVHRTCVARGVTVPGQPVGTAVVATSATPELGPAAHAACLPAWVAAAARAGAPAGPLHFTGPAGLRIADDALWCGPDRVHALVEGAVVDGPARMRFVLLAKDGRLSLHSGPVAAVLNDRRLLAELSRAADEDDPMLDPAERAAVRAVVPWTRPLRDPGPALAARSRIVVKRADSTGGTAVYLGPHTPQRAWAALVTAAAAEGGWVLQRYLSPGLPPGVLPPRPGAHVVWGAFVVAGRYAGGFARVLAGDGYRPPAVAGAVPVADGPNGDAHVPIAPLAETPDPTCALRPTVPGRFV